MKTLILALAFLFFATNPLFAQDSFFEAGYIVQQADTIRGLVERTDETTLSQTVNFRAAPEAEIKTYLPEALSGFGFTKDRLVFEPVQVTLKKDNKTWPATRFAKKLLTGNIHLYKLQLPESERTVIFKPENTFVFVLQQNENFYTLGQYEFRLEGKAGLQKQYIGMLTALLSDCPEAIKGINDLPFKDKAISDRIKQYNACKAPGVVTVQHQSEVKPKLKHGPVAGYTRLFSPGNAREYTIAFISDTYKIVRSNGVSAGYFLDVLKPDLNRRTALQTGFNYVYLEHTLKFKDYRNNDLLLNVATHSIMLPLTAQFNFNKKADAKNYPFLSAGFTARFYTNNEFSGLN
ncbi:MAG TPA: outer membrane beta-barrel protein, partial [Adhaeribacter sp.]|nr:outer membrane beta-barrel protein [Adhaeribacter sp.]